MDILKACVTDDTSPRRGHVMMCVCVCYWPVSKMV